jgi:hypothetical protein
MISQKYSNSNAYNSVRYLLLIICKKTESLHMNIKLFMGNTLACIVAPDVWIKSRFFIPNSEIRNQRFLAFYLLWSKYITLKKIIIQNVLSPQKM